MTAEIHALEIDCVPGGLIADVILSPEDMDLIESARAQQLQADAAAELRAQALERLTARAGRDEVLADLLTVLGVVP